MKSYLIAISILLTTCLVNNKIQAQHALFAVTGKKISVYTTADSTEYRLSPMGTLSFKDMGQPFETQIYVARGETPAVLLVENP